MKTFQDSLRETIINRMDPKLDRKDVLIDIFKTYVAKMLEQNVMANKNRLEAKYLQMLKAYMITEFRNADLGEFQISEKMYDELFNKTIEEIFNDASHTHQGENKAEHSNQELVVNKQAYDEMKLRESGLWVPPSANS